MHASTVIAVSALLFSFGQAAPTVASTEALVVSRDTTLGPKAPISSLPHISGDDAALVRRGTSNSCAFATLNDLKAMPQAYADVQAYAKATWGDNWDTIVLNDPDYADSPAQSCFTTDTITPVWAANPTCSVSTTKLSGTVASGSNLATINIQQGDTITTSTTTETSSSIAIGVSTEVEVDLEIFKSKTTYSLTGTITNTKGTTHTDTNNRVTSISDAITCKGPANVEVDLEVNTCTAAGTATVPAVLGGWVWFHYGKAVGEKGDKHYKWAVNLDDVGISPLAHRTANTVLKVNGALTSYGKFTSHC